MVKLVLDRPDSETFVKAVNTKSGSELVLTNKDGKSKQVNRFYLPNGFGIKVWQEEDKTKFHVSLYKIKD